MLIKKILVRMALGYCVLVLLHTQALTNNGLSHEQYAAQYPSYSEKVIDKHSCVKAEDGQLPTGVVYRTETGIAKFGGPRMVALTLDQIFGTGKTHFTVYLFCR